MLPFIDLHTHTPSASIAEGKTIALLNLPFPPRNAIIPRPGKNLLFSTGIHPMDSEHALFQEFELFFRRHRTNFSAVGECGLDRRVQNVSGAGKELFLQHILLAENLNMPLIIHCVRALPELFALRKRHPAGIWILHGFRGNDAEFNALFRHNIIPSLSSGYVMHRKLPSLRRETPFFLETDDSRLRIEELYNLFASISGFPPELLKETIYNCFRKIFPCLSEKIS